MMFAAAGASEHWQEQIIYGLGGGIPLFLATTLGWIVGYVVTRNMKKALWTWTALILVASALLAIGVFCTQPSTLFTHTHESEATCGWAALTTEAATGSRHKHASAYGRYGP